ncbi:MAG TPA: tetratricopeptide repeat protein [Pyrinomonadaceae bacterium]
MGAVSPGETGDVSPNAATVPLAGHDARATDGLPPEEPRAAAQTSRVSLAEMERLLREHDAAQQPAPRPDPEATHVRHSPAATRPDLDPAEYDEELTISVPRAAREPDNFEATADFEATRPADFDATLPASPAPTPSSHVTRDAPADPPEAEAVGAPPPAVEARGAAPAARPRRAWPLVVAVCAAVAVFAAGGAWLAFRLLRRPAVTDVPTQGPTAPPAAPDARQQFEEKLAEAEAALAGGDMQSALARLREANELDPSNTRAHRRLAELLQAAGRTREAIEEYRAVTRSAPDDFDGWNRLASLQTAEGLDRDAVESFRRFIALMGGEAAVSPPDLLAYSRALLRSGQTDEARALFQRLASGPDSSVSAAAGRELEELTRAHPTPQPTPRAGEPSPTPRTEETASLPNPQPTAPQPAPTQPPPQPAPAPAPQRPAGGTPAERYSRGVQLWPANRAAALEEFRAAAAAGNYDAHYYLGLSFVEGRSAAALKRAEVVAALQHFQLAQRGSQHASQARGYAQQLEKEFDRLRRQ